MPGIFSNLFGGAAARQAKKRDEQWLQDSRSGRPGALASINPLASGGKAWQVERDRRRRDVQMNYRSDRKKLIQQRRQAERELRQDLKREREKIERYYQRKEGSLGADEVEDRIREKFRREENEMERKFDRSWRDKEHDLKSERDKQYRQITASMQRELREARDLPNRTGLPWT